MTTLDPLADLRETLADALPGNEDPAEVDPQGGDERTADSPAALQSRIRGEIVGWLMDKEATATEKHREISCLVVAALAELGAFYFHAERRDFDSAMFFNRDTKRLERVRSDAFVAWLSDWLHVNRADTCFRFVLSAVETAALHGKLTRPVIPEAFWCGRPGAVYLSNGDGSIAKITANGVEPCDNGTDGVLFPAGRTLAPWKHVEIARDPFETCALFRDAQFADPHGLDLVRLWMLSLPTAPRSKPPVTFSGTVGSGKTRILKGACELLGLPFVAQKVEDDGEDDFWPTIDGGGLFVLDNADTKCRWLADALANAATDGSSQRRKLYTNNETVTCRARSWLAITTANPTFASDAGLADRLLVVRMDRRSGETSDSALTDEILANRDAGMTYIAWVLSSALGDTDPVPSGLNRRHPDFASFAVRIGRAIGREAQAVEALRAAEADKSAFCLENDPVGAALLSVLADGAGFHGTAAELRDRLVAADQELEDRLSVKRLGKRLAALWPHIEAAFGAASREVNRKGITVFAIGEPASAGFAGFQTVIP